MQRIVVVGSGGAGKTTVACEMSRVLGIEVIHLDSLYWGPGWVSSGEQRWTELQRELVARPRWILDGNYRSTMAIRFEAADTIVFVDEPRWRCLWRVVRRRLSSWARRPRRPDLPAGCRDQLRWEFVRYIWNFPTTMRPRVLELIERYRGGRRVVILRGAAAVRVLIGALETTATNKSAWLFYQ